MGIKDSSKLLKQLRIYNNQTQEEFCDGICSTQFLSRIENHHATPSPFLFNQLCSKAGVKEYAFNTFYNELHLKTYLELRSLHYRFMYKNNYNIVDELNSIYEHGYFSTYEYKCWLFLAYVTLRKYSIISHVDLSILNKIINSTNSNFSDFISPISTVLDYEIYFYAASDYNNTYAFTKRIDSTPLSNIEKIAIKQLIYNAPTPINSCKNNQLFNSLITLKHYCDIASPPIVSLDEPTFTINQTVQHIRKKQNITQETLSRGLCSRCTLSRFESGLITITPIVLESLFERLGLFNTAFTIWGSAKDAMLYDMRNTFIRTGKCNVSKLNNLSRDVSVDTEAILISQFSDLISSSQPDTSKQILILENSLHKTQPMFNVERILDYKMTINEIEILNQLTETLLREDSLRGEKYLRALLDYYRNTPYISNYTNMKSHTLNLVSNLINPNFL